MPSGPEERTHTVPPVLSAAIFTSVCTAPDGRTKASTTMIATWGSKVIVDCRLATGEYTDCRLPIGDWGFYLPDAARIPVFIAAAAPGLAQ
jgi:hypothetical protein